MRNLDSRAIDLDLLKEKYLPRCRREVLEATFIADRLQRANITNGFPESGGGGASATESACTEATGTDAAPEAGDGDDDGGDGDGDPDGRRPSFNLSPLRASRATRQKTGVNLPPENADCELWRLPTVLERIPVSRTSWLAGVKSGLYPKPLKIGLRAVAWRASDIRALVASL